MNKRMILAIAALMIFGLSVAAFAYRRSAGTATTAASSTCCDSDSCPMKHANASTADTASSCDDCDCCKGSDFCLVKMKGEKASAAGIDMPNVTVSTGGKRCDGSCCKQHKAG